MLVSSRTPSQPVARGLLRRTPPRILLVERASQHLALAIRDVSGDRADMRRVCGFGGKGHEAPPRSVRRHHRHPWSSTPSSVISLQQWNRKS
ncbi:hypothetical protein PVAP13_6NG220803 [Panicum virgatum]|uniref:Uncharacterized protein n=1 Tax=Panicum virgatum TaxID=38727 RepID=A0A8T0QZ70_PANVG|nr:hypothetical protein PVAP13_6NG220803 [Panicum virgatum]